MHRRAAYTSHSSMPVMTGRTWFGGAKAAAAALINLEPRGY